MNPVAMATPAVGILTALSAVSIRCGSAGSWEGVASECGQMLALGPAALSSSPVSQPWGSLHFRVNSLDTALSHFPSQSAHTRRSTSLTRNCLEPFS